jgi:hypothetical protein
MFSPASRGDRQSRGGWSGRNGGERRKRGEIRRYLSHETDRYSTASPCAVGTAGMGQLKRRPGGIELADMEETGALALNVQIDASSGLRRR